jgi:hypothetical protein
MKRNTRDLRLYEVVCPTSWKAELFNQHFEMEINDYPWIWYVYFPNQELSPVFVTLEQDTYEPLENFLFFLNNINNPNYIDILLLCTLYMHKIHVGKRQYKKNLLKIHHKGIREILKPTYGALVFTTQLEAIYQVMTRCTDAEAIEFRKQWNKKELERTQHIKSISVQKDYSLFDVITKTSCNPNHFVFTPNYQGADQIIHQLNK